MRHAAPLALAGAALALSLGTTGHAQSGGPQGAPTSAVDSKHDTSPRLRDMPPQPYVGKQPHEANHNPRPRSIHTNQPDTVVQNTPAASAMPSSDQNFDGVGYPGVACNCAPPDTNGEVGKTQYAQIVNEGFQVFDKATGTSVFGPVGIATLWSGFGGVCEFNGDGDPVLLYDQLADRWVVSQFAGSSVPTDECIAVSTTSDATGSYNRYAFYLGSNFFDYPKLAVWPDAYYMSMNVFNSSGTAFLGPQPFAFDRTAMLAGQAATFVTTGITGGSFEETYLPSDIDGSTLPPAGAPNTFVEFPGANGVYKVFHFHADFATPANTTFTLFASPAAAGYTELCPTTRSCVPQSGTTSKLDGIGDRFMYRAAYRNFGDHESVVSNYTVSSGGVAGVRWIELRNVTNGPVTVFQESTYQPDSTWRWMGSAAMDGNGNLAVGFSASSASMNPAIRYAGRLATDPLNTLGQGEATLFNGTGSQVGTVSRWGDYSALTVDPVDDCTFWYTTEYYATTSSFNWHTRIGSFKFPQCVSGPPGAFGKVSPQNGATSQPSSLNLTWGASTNATSYDYCYDTVNNNTCDTSWISAGTSTSVSISGLAVNTSYFWQVRANNPGGTTYADGSAAAFWNFATAPSLPPTADSVTPSSGSGANGTFVYKFSDPNGASDISAALILINSSFSPSNACYVALAPRTGKVWLVNDAADAAFGPATIGTPSFLENSQCIFDAADSSMSKVGSTLTLNLALIFKGGFTGAQTQFMQAIDRANQASGWMSNGTWTVTNQAPTLVSVTPSSGGGSSQAFSYVFSDPNGASDITSTQMVLNSTLRAVGGCYFAFVRASNQFYLVNDAGNATLGPVTAGTNATLQNSQCILDASASSSASAGTMLTVNVALSFKAAFAGAKNNYMLATDSANQSSAFTIKGTYTAQ